MANGAEAERLQAVLKGADLAPWDLDVDSGVATVGTRWFTMLGLPADDDVCTFEAWSSRLHPDDRVRVLEARRAHLAGETGSYEAIYRLRHEDDRWLWVLDRGQVLARDDQGRPLRMAGAQLDISASMQGQAALRADHAKMRTTFEALRSGVVVHDADTRILECNGAACEILGLTPAQMFGRSAVDPAWHFLESDGSTMPPARFPASRVLSSGQAIADELAGIVRPDRDHTTWVLVNAVPMTDDRGRILGVVVAFSDVTELHESRAHLQAMQDRLAATLAAVPDLLFEITRSGLIVDSHAPRAALLVRPTTEQIGRRVSEVLPARAAVVVMRAVDDALADGFSVGLQYALDLPDGARWFELSVAPKRVADGEEPRCIVLTRDITERRRADRERRLLEAQLRDAQKLEAIGTLASGIAHDFNNIVAGVLGNANLALRDLPPDHPAAASIRQIELAGQRARSLVEQIMAYSRPEPVRMVEVTLDGAVRETLALLRATAPAGVRLVERLPPQPVHVRGDATQLQQVVMNLCLNAWQALPDGGGEVLVAVRLEGGRACLSVRDNGSGMDEATRRRIFEPFFSTKARGRGTGLGLAVVHGIVHAHHGHIEVDSRTGEGTEFRLWLPAVDAAPADVHAALPAAPEGFRGRGEHVVYVDDDEILRQLVPRLLEQAGWRVTACADAASALAALAQVGPEPALLLSDMNMPDISGLSLGQRVRALHPGLPVVLISGHVDTGLRRQAQAQGVASLVAKERLLDELAPAVAAALALAGATQGGS